MKIRSFNAIRAEIYGHKLNKVQKAILIRSKPYVHTEIQFGPFHDGISFSATMAEGEDCARFKHISYDHSTYWDVIEVPLTEIQENVAYGVAKGMEGMPYDKWGVLSLASEYDIIEPDDDKVWCSKAVARVITEVVPLFGLELTNCGFPYPFNIDPARFHMLAEYWFRGR